MTDEKEIPTWAQIGKHLKWLEDHPPAFGGPKNWEQRLEEAGLDRALYNEMVGAWRVFELLRIHEDDDHVMMADSTYSGGPMWSVAKWVGGRLDFVATKKTPLAAMRAALEPE